MSRHHRSTVLLPLLLIGACAALGWKIYDDWRVASANTAAAPPDAAAPAAAPQPPLAEADLALALPPPERFAVIVERSLFSATRRPPAPAQAQAPEPAPEALPAPELEAAAEAAPPPVVDFTLVGIVIAGKERYALVERHAGRQVVEVPEGGAVSGWFAVLIDADRAVFRQGAVEEELELKYKTPVPEDRIPPRRAAPPPEQPDLQQQQLQQQEDSAQHK